MKYMKDKNRTSLDKKCTIFEMKNTGFFNNMRCYKKEDKFSDIAMQTIKNERQKLMVKNEQSINLL